MDGGGGREDDAMAEPVKAVDEEVERVTVDPLQGGQARGSRCG